MSKKTAPKKTAKKSAKPAQAKAAPKKVLPAAKKAAVGKKTPPAKKAAAVSAAKKKGANAPARRVIASVKPDRLAKLRESVNAKAQPKRIAQTTISAPKPAAQKKTENVKKTSKKTAEKKPAKTEKTKAAASVAEKNVEKPQKEASAPKEPERQFAAPASKRKTAHLRPSHNIYFSMEDLNAYFEKREAQTERVQKEKSAAKKTASAAKPAPAPAVPKKPLAVATIFDILGLNPVVAQTHEKLDEQDVPRKWKKYYKMLVDLRKHHSSGVEQRSEEVLKRSAKDDAGDLSSYGQHLADAGSESFERDMAYNLISNQKEVLSEIEKAIKRIKNGTYGICEITGKPIPESRLMSIPYTRCTKEGQEIKEREAKRIKASQRSALYDMGDGSSSSSSPDEEAGS